MLTLNPDLPYNFTPLRTPMNFTLLKTPAEMAALDQATLDLGLPELLLMENAARSIWQILQHKFTQPRPRRILIFMGSGHNGGDAVALARNLQASGEQVLVLHSRPLKSYMGSCAQHLRLAKKFQVPLADVARYLNKLKQPDKLKPMDKLKQSIWEQPDLVIDGLLGTGFEGQLRPLEQRIIQCINSFTCPIVAIDIPSGLSGTRGQPRVADSIDKTQPNIVQAQLTISFAAAKPGLILGQAYVGELRITDIGIPQSLLQAQTSCYQLLPSILPQRTTNFAHKGIAGHCLILGGSKGLMGAPQLTALAALRSGCGLVSLVLPEGDPLHLDPNFMAIYLGTSPTHWHPDLVPELKPQLTKAKSIVIGPGLGTAPATMDFLQAYLNLPHLPPQIIDASALELFAQDPSLLSKLRPLDILTPHPGEAAKLLQCSNAELQAKRLEAIAELQKLAPCTWILKGAHTLISSPNQPITISPFQVPNLAIAGSGDVLAGCLAYYLMHYPAPETACRGVVHHALAGLKLAKTYPQRGNLASDIATALSEITGYNLV